MSQVPAATRALRVLRFLATQPGPVPVDRVMRACDLPRSSAYHLLRAMADEDSSCTCPRTAPSGSGRGLRGRQRLRPLRAPGAAGAAPAGRPRRRHRRQRPAGRAARPRRAVRRAGARPGRPPARHGRRRAAARARHRQRAGGPGGTARTPGAGAVRRRRGVPRHGRHGPRSLSELRTVLAETRQRGHAVEHEEVSEGLASVAAAVLDHTGHPVAAVAVTLPVGEDVGPAVAGVVRTAGVLGAGSAVAGSLGPTRRGVRRHGRSDTTAARGTALGLVTAAGATWAHHAAGGTVGPGAFGLAVLVSVAAPGLALTPTRAPRPCGCWPWPRPRRAPGTCSSHRAADVPHRRRPRRARTDAARPPRGRGGHDRPRARRRPRAARPRPRGAGPAPRARARSPVVRRDERRPVGTHRRRSPTARAGYRSREGRRAPEPSCPSPPQQPDRRAAAAHHPAARR